MADYSEGTKTLIKNIQRSELVNEKEKQKNPSLVLKKSYGLSS